MSKCIETQNAFRRCLLHESYRIIDVSYLPWGYSSPLRPEPLLEDSSTHHNPDSTTKCLCLLFNAVEVVEQWNGGKSHQHLVLKSACWWVHFTTFFEDISVKTCSLSGKWKYKKDVMLVQTALGCTYIKLQCKRLMIACCKQITVNI